jgi:hypothetical protein
MEFEKVIFIDIDGVLATEECWQITEPRFGKKHIYRWNDKCVAVLNEIITETDCDIVLSSDWRIHFDMKTLDEIFKWNNVIKSPVDVTDKQKYKLSSNSEIDRIHQIGRYLENNSIKNWVCVDDLNLKSDIVPNFVQVDQEFGISYDGVKNKLIEYLTKNK